MSSKKSFVFAFGALVTGALVYGCSSSSDGTTPPPADGGSTTDSSHGNDAVADSKPDHAPMDAAPQCAPQDVSTFAPPAYHPAHATPGACTNQQILDYYAQCHAAGTTNAMCTTFKMTIPASCSSCIEGKSTDATWPATYVTNHVVWVNISGCMELLGGSTGLDCAKKVQATAACGDAACLAVCPVTDDASFQLYQACVQQVDMAGCAAYAQASAACENAATMADGGAAGCFGPTSFETYFDQIVPIFCGGGTSDGGTDAPSDAPHEGG